MMLAPEPPSSASPPLSASPKVQIASARASMHAPPSYPPPAAPTSPLSIPSPSPPMPSPPPPTSPPPSPLLASNQPTDQSTHQPTTAVLSSSPTSPLSSPSSPPSSSSPPTSSPSPAAYAVPPFDPAPPVPQPPSSRVPRGETKRDTRRTSPRAGGAGREIASGMPVFEGFLTKKGKTRHSWRVRWFVLTGEAMVYYTKQNCFDEKGRIWLRDIIAVCKRDRAANHPFLFEVATNHRVFLIRAQSENEREDWVRSINLTASRYLKGNAVEEIRLTERDPTTETPGRKATFEDPAGLDAKRAVYYIDVIVVEASAVRSSTDICPPATGLVSYFTSKRDPNPHPYVSLTVGVQEYMTATVQSDRNPVWNQDCTFTLTSHSEVMSFLLYDENNRMLGQDILIGAAHLDVASLQWNSICDIWVQFNSLHQIDPDDPAAQDRESGSSGSNLPSNSDLPGNSNLSNLSSSLSSSSEESVGNLHLMIFKSYGMKSGFLSHWGKPMRSISMRLSAGDIILISSPAAATQAVKLATGSQWDHVAMVTQLPGRSSSLRLFEATIEGVHEYGLDYALALYHSNCKLGIRRLLTEPTEEAMAALCAFVSEVRGRPYKQEWWQMIRAARGSNRLDDLSSIFCSQLIAAAFQSLGLIPADVHTNNFVPGDFASLEGLGKQLNMHLGPLIVLEKKEAPEVLKAKDSSSDPFGVTLTDQRGNAVGFFFTSVSVLSARNLINNSGSKLTSYCIEVETTEGKSWTVWQRYNSFYELDRNLRKRFEGVRTLPPKTIVRNRFDSNVIKHRCAQLHSYLQPLIKGPTAFDPALLSFLGCTDRGHKDAHSSAVSSSLVMLPNQLNRRTAQIQLVHTATVQSPLRTMGAAPPPYEAPDVTNLASPRDTSRPRRKKGSNNNNNSNNSNSSSSSSSSSMNSKSKHYNGSRSRSHKSPRDGSDKPSSSPSSSSQTTSGKRKTPSRGTGSNPLSSDPASSRPKSEAKPASKPRRPRSRATQLTLTAPPGINNNNSSSNNNNNDDNANANANISIANTNAPSTDCTSQPSPDPAPSDLPGNLPPERYLDEMFKRYSGQKLFLANARSVQRSASSRRRATLQHSVSEDSLHEKYHLEAPEDAFQSASNLSAALDLNSSVVEHRDF